MRIPLLLLTGPLCLAWAQSGEPLSRGLLQRYETARLNMVEAAEFMPAHEYQYRLSPQQRTYGEWFAHTAVMNLRMCAAIKGEQAPLAKELPATAGKEELQKALKDSFAYCDGTYRDMSDARALAQVEVGGRKYYPVDPMINHVVALNEHYGNLVGYLRTKGIVPPTTVRAQKMKKQ